MTGVKAWDWRDEHGTRPEAMIRRGRAHLFIPLADLYRVADALVDVAEQHEQHENTDRRRHPADTTQEEHHD